jgi:hypothetical protein
MGISPSHSGDHDKYLWGIERRSDTPERLVFIYEALSKLDLAPDFSIIDIACGRAVVIDGLYGLFPKCRPTILDIEKYEYDWAKLKRGIVKLVMPLQEFIQRNNETVYDVVMMLNSYRNWKGRKYVDKEHTQTRGAIKNSFDLWLVDHARYFIASGAELPYERGEIRGHDFHGELQLFKLPLSGK